LRESSISTIIKVNNKIITNLAQITLNLIIVADRNSTIDEISYQILNVTLAVIDRSVTMNINVKNYKNIFIHWLTHYYSKVANF